LRRRFIFQFLRRRVKRAAKLQQQSEEQARRELTQPMAINPGDPRMKTKLFWVSDTIDSTLVPVTAELPLSNDPVLRSKQVLNTLLAGPVDAELRTFAAGRFTASVLSLARWNGDRGFLRGAGNFDPFRDRERAVGRDSITRTLEANVPQVQRLKILIHGQEVETLAGAFGFDRNILVNTKVAQEPVKSAPTASTTDKPPARVLPTLTAGRPPANWVKLKACHKLSSTGMTTAGGRVRADGRTAEQMRPLKITPDFISTAEGSVLIELGNTRVICTATVDDGVPSFLKGSGKGWVTSEYGMLPRATEERTPREAARGKQSGRTLEIQRPDWPALFCARDGSGSAGRAHRMAGLRRDSSGCERARRSITGAFVALALAFERLTAAGILKKSPLIDYRSSHERGYCR